jgi:hypothetical protein
MDTDKYDLASVCVRASYTIPRKSTSIIYNEDINSARLMPQGSYFRANWRAP